MKKISLVLFVCGLLLVLCASCSLTSYSACPAYSHQNKMTKSGERAQVKFVKRNRI